MTTRIDMLETLRHGVPETDGPRRNISTFESVSHTTGRWTNTPAASVPSSVRTR